MSDRVQDIRATKLKSVCRAFENQIPETKIAAKVGVSPPTVSKWLKQEGYKHKKGGRIPLAMKARVRDLHLRNWQDEDISRLLCLSMDRVKELSKPQGNPALGLDKDPLRIKGLKKKKKKKKVKEGRGRPRKKVKEPGWPPPRHRCRKHWRDDEKKYVIQLIKEGVSPGGIYKRMRASKKRQRRIWKEAGGKGDPPNFPPSKGPFTPPEGPIAPRAREAVELADEDRIAQLEAEAKDRQKKIAELEKQKELEEAKLKQLKADQKKLSIKSREKEALLEAAEAAMAKRKGLPPPAKKKKRVLEGSYEAEVLGMPVGALVAPGKPGRPKKKPISEWADNGRYFVVSRQWPELKKAKDDELQLFAAFLTSKRFPARVERTGKPPKAYFENTWPANVAERWEKTVEAGFTLLEKYRDKKLAIKKKKGFTKRIAAYLIAVYQGYRNPKLNAAQRAEARALVEDQWARMSKVERLVVIYDMKLADPDGKPTTTGIDRSLAAKILVEKASKRASRKLKDAKKKQRKVLLAEVADDAEVDNILNAAKEDLALPEEDEVDEVAALLAATKDRLALPEGEED